MIDWVDERLKAWGRAKRGLTTRAATVKSLLGRLIEEGGGASHRNFPIIDPPEVLTDDALHASVAIQKALATSVIGESDYELLFAHYVCRDRLCGECGQRSGHFSIGDKRRALGLTRAK